ncbi:pescadillo, partial [Tanacetum coccineum]
GTFVEGIASKSPLAVIGTKNVLLNRRHVSAARFGLRCYLKLLYLLSDDLKRFDCSADARRTCECCALHVPRESLLFFITSFSGVVSWEGDGAPFEESNQDINYQIVDRPTQSHKFISRDYIQPQWVFDCMNARIKLTTKDNMVGKVPPPHRLHFLTMKHKGMYPSMRIQLKGFKKLQSTFPSVVGYCRIILNI